MNTQQIPNEGISETHNSWMKCSWLWLSGRWGLLQSRAQPSQHSVASREWPSVGLQATQFGLLPLGWGLVEFIFFHQQIFIEHPLWNRRWPECLPRSTQWRRAPQESRAWGQGASLKHILNTLKIMRNDLLKNLIDLIDSAQNLFNLIDSAN